MNYLSSIEIAKRWGISTRRVIRLAQEGRIPDAKFVGKNWVFPETAEKPADGRKSGAKIERVPAERTDKKQDNDFRFPLLVNFNVSHFYPRLSEEERKLRDAQLAFYACRYDEAEPAFRTLENKTKYIHVRISALYYLCLISVYAHGGSNYENRRAKFDLALAGDFPYKKELELTAYWLDMDIGFNQSIYENFGIDETYEYNPAVYHILCFLSAISSTNGDFAFFSQQKFSVYEVLARQAEREGHYFEALQMNMLMFSAYHFQNNKKKMNYYLNKALQIVKNRQLYAVIITYETLYPKEFRAALSAFPAEFSQKITTLSNQFHKSYTKFMRRYNNFSVYGNLSKADYQYVLYATQSYSNKTVAKITNHTEAYVTNKYCEIYLKLDVKSKQELIDLCKKTMSNPR